MPELLLSTFISPEISLDSSEALPTSSLLVAQFIYVMGGIVLVATASFPVLRALGLLIGYARWLVSQAPRMWTRSPALGDPLDGARPLSLTGLSPALARLARQTRTLALELRRRSEEARHWPDDVAELESVRGSWWRSALTDSVDFSPLMDTRREVYDWLQSAERLGARDRETLAGLGVDVDAVREALIARQGVAEHIRTLAGLLWTIDDRLLEATSQGYRATANPGSAAARSGGLGALARLPCFAAPTGERDEGEGEDQDQPEARDRQRRFAELLGAHGSGLSRLAGSYARDRAEREDIEQDIAMALWQSLPRFRGESSLRTFAYRVARYCCYRYVRRRARPPVDGDVITELGDPESFEQQLLAADARARIERALAELPDSLESAVHLHLAGLSDAEVAARLGISERNVSVRLTRARHRLRAGLAAA